MNAFNKIAGYETIKTELLQICDILRNQQRYKNLGARLPKGVLISGASGTGKTLMAECFLEECGVNVFSIDEADCSYKSPAGLSEAFAEAREYAPAVVFIENLDNIADNAFYRVLQAEIDRSSNKEILVIATTANTDDLPDTLLRAGRFDRKIEICLPTENDLHKIIKYYLREKKVANRINYDDLAKMFAFCSCATIKTIINEAAINAGFSERESIHMKDFVDAYLRNEYISPDAYTTVSDDDLRKVALHEAGHLIISEVLCPGSIGIVSVRTNGRDDLNGFTSRCKELPIETYDVLISLGGKAAVELYYAESCASGCYSDIRKVFRNIRRGISKIGTCGLGMIDVDMYGIGMSENMNARSEAVVHAEMEKYMFKARDILIKNREFLEKATELLLKKRTLLYSDIKKLKESVTITEVAV